MDLNKIDALYSELEQKVKDKILEIGISKTSKILGYANESYLSQFVHGKNKISKKQLKKFMEVLGVK